MKTAIEMQVSSEPRPFFDADSLFEVASKHEAIVNLWAHALQEEPEYVSVMLPGAVERMDNWHMRGKEPPKKIENEVLTLVDHLNRHRETIQKDMRNDSPNVWVEFRDHRGELVQDEVRAVSNTEHLLEPYARNTVEAIVILKRYSWIPVKDIVRWLDADHPIEIVRAD